MSQQAYPPGWDEERVKRVLAHYEQQSEEEAVAEDEAAFEKNDQAVIEVPYELIPAIRELIAKHQPYELTMPEFVKVARTDDIPVGQARMVEVNGQEIALFNVGGSFHAIDNTCTHVGGPLCEGEVEGIEVTCPWHGAVFDVTTGQVLGPPAGQAVGRYNVRVDGPDIEVEV